jgi:flagellar transcriptional activator FlhD
MDSEQLLAEIREANLTYLMLAQNLIRKDRAEALFRLGLTEEAADLLGMLSTAQLLKIASSNMLLCRFRVDDDLVWNLLTSHNVKKVDNSTTTQLHASPGGGAGGPAKPVPRRPGLKTPLSSPSLWSSHHGHRKKHPERVA